MSFSVQHRPTGLEYSGSGLNGLFAQRRNILNPSFARMLFQINRFNSECLEVLEGEKYTGYTLADYCKEKNYGKSFLDKYLIPMSAAVWSSPREEMLKFPARTLIGFFKNHGFLGLDTQHQWFTVVDGSRSYREKLIAPFKDQIHISSGVKEVRRVHDKIEIRTANSEPQYFDKVIFASHADETLRMISDPTAAETHLLKPFKYQLNKAVLHTDRSIMPANKKVWSSWNYRIEHKQDGIKASTIYYMNRLQHVSKKNDYFVSINDPGNVAEDKIIRTIDYDHPLFNLEAIESQRWLHLLNRQNNNTFFCGSYFKHGFHEDAFTSAVQLCQLLKKDLVW